jgi:hypothetical protein
LDPITAMIQIRQKNGGYNVIAKKIKSVSKNYTGSLNTLPESSLMSDAALKNCDFVKAFMKQGCTDILDDGFSKKISVIFE